MQIKLHNNQIEATILSKGAELASLKFNQREYIWDANPNFWAKHSPILFPIVGTLINNSYYFQNKEYKLSRHGFARDFDFELIESGSDFCILSLKNNDVISEIYPFNFELQLHYTLINNKLELKYKIFNLSETEMPFAIGAHPAFNLKYNFEDYELEFDNDDLLIAFQLENDLISETTSEINLQNKKLQLNYQLFENDALVFKKFNSKHITILEKNIPLLKISFDDFKNLGLWTKPNASFICIEPWLGYADTTTADGNILNKEAINLLAINQQFECKFDIAIF